MSLLLRKSKKLVVKGTKWFAFLFYYSLAKRLPISGYPGGGVARQLRFAAAKRLFRSCGADVNVEKGADFGFGDGISIGSRSGIGVDAWIRAEIEIGCDVMMGPRVIIYGRDHIFIDINKPMNQQGMGDYKKIYIEDNVWIGAGVIILSGVRVGTGAIIGAGTVVTKDVPKNAIFVGNPGRLVRTRCVNIDKQTIK